MADCQKCIYPQLRGCPVMGSKNCAACLELYKDRNTCKAEHCPTCKLLKYCKEKKINLNEKHDPIKCRLCNKDLKPNKYKRVQLSDITSSFTEKLNVVDFCIECFLKITEDDSYDKEN